MPRMKPPSPAEQVAGWADTWALVAVARRWQVTIAEVRRLLGSGELDFCQIAGQFRIPKTAVDELERQRGGTTEQPSKITAKRAPRRNR